MSQNKNITDIINAFALSFITAIIFVVGKHVIQIFNEKIEKLNEEVVWLKAIIEENNNTHNFHLSNMELNMPVCIGVGMQTDREIFANPKYRNNIPNSQHFSFDIECLKRLPLVKYIDMIGYQRIIINGSNKYISELTEEEKLYIKQICDECGVKVDNAIV